MDTKKCTRCGEEKPLEDFRPRNGRCRPCERAVNRLRREQMPPEQRKEKLAEDRERKRRWREANPEKHQRQKLRKNRKDLAERIKKDQQTLRDAARAEQRDIKRYGSVSAAWWECWFRDTTFAKQRLAKDLPVYLKLVTMDLRSEDERRGITRISYEDRMEELVSDITDRMIKKSQQRTEGDHADALEALKDEMPAEPDTDFDMNNPAWRKWFSYWHDVMEELRREWAEEEKRAKVACRRAGFLVS